MISGGQPVRLLLGVTDSDGQHIPAGMQGMAIGFRGERLIVSFDRPYGRVTAEVEEKHVVRTGITRRGR